MHFSFWSTLFLHGSNFWQHNEPSRLAQPYLPQLKLAPDPTADEQAGFVQATADTQHQGVLDAAGSRKPPHFNHHVDNYFYADIGIYIPLGVAASSERTSPLSNPRPSHTRGDPLSWDRFHTTYLHKRGASPWAKFGSYYNLFFQARTTHSSQILEI
jgi:hypothetical protein